MQYDFKFIVLVIPLLGLFLTSFIILKDLPPTSSNSDRFLRKHKQQHSLDSNNDFYHQSNTIFRDNYCDLSSGLDELHTSACSYILVGKEVFLCDNGKKRLFSSRIDDYVCDCQDGSDETMTKACIL